MRDCNYRLLGYSNDRGTYDTGGRNLFAGSVPAMLLERSGCKKPLPTPWR